MSAFSCLLELDERFLKYEDRDSLEMAARLWEKAGRPRARRELIEFLENVLKGYQRECRHYAPILLRRKRELQRCDWKPGVQRNSATAGQGPNQGGFSKCCIGGYLANGTICPCPKGEPHRELFRKWGMKV